PLLRRAAGRWTGFQNFGGNLAGVQGSALTGYVLQWPIPPLLTCHRCRRILLCGGHRSMDEAKSEILQGTLDLMVLKTLHALGPLHGYGIARRLEQISEDVLQLNQGTIYA